MLPRFLVLLIGISLPLLADCSSSRRVDHPAGEERDFARDEDDDEEMETASPRPAAPWGEPTMSLRAIDTPADTVSFHIGSPLLLRISGARDLGCAPFDGRPFYFEASGAQSGWGFVEVADSSLLPRTPSGCDRYLLLTSENSNGLPEGMFALKTLVFVDEKRSIYSDTLYLRAVRSTDGADSASFNRFLIEQILRNTPLLTDPETLAAVFGPGTPRSAESEVYRAVILARGGDPAGARKALAEADRLAKSRGRPLDENASRVFRLMKDYTGR